MLQPRIQKVSTKGQVVIPADFRKYLNIENGKVIMIPIPQEQKILIKPAAGDPIKAARGILSDWQKSATQIMKEARQEEKEFEKKKLSNLHLR